MITVITGTPGAGKTLYTIEKLLLPLVGTHIPQEVDGVTTLHPRTIYTNIKGLLIDHELIQADSDEGLHNWHNWAKPGSVIVIDEFQRWWPPRPNGSQVPDDISALDTHRHMGVDFILITQNVMNADRHIHGLANRHLHVRRMANLHLAIVYEWDHCSRTLMFSKSLTKSPWRYNKKTFKLYHSADLHTKQPRSIPGLVWFILVAVIGLAALGPTAYGRMQDRMNPQQAKGPAKPAAGPSAASGKASALPASAIAAVPAAETVSRPAEPIEQLSGCARLKEICRCYDQAARVLERPAAFCQAQTTAPVAPGGGSLDHVPDLGANATLEPDLDMVEWTTKQRRIAVAYR